MKDILNYFHLEQKHNAAYCDEAEHEDAGKHGLVNNCSVNNQSKMCPNLDWEYYLFYLRNGNDIAVIESTQLFRHGMNLNEFSKFCRN